MRSNEVGEHSPPNGEIDVLVVGAGMSGLYLLYKLREAGFSTIALEKGGDIGGTWYWNRYPGCRCDVPSIDYSYSFDRGLEKSWQWKRKYPSQPEILEYLHHVAERHNLRKLIQFECHVTEMCWEADNSHWIVRTAKNDIYHARFVVMATGCLSHPKEPGIPSLDNFHGDVYHTARWPHHGVDFTGKRVGVIGTGSSGVQAIPKLAEQATELTVFQRTACFTFPARDGPINTEELAKFQSDIDAYREAQRKSTAGMIFEISEKGAMELSEDERNKKYEEKWMEGNFFAALSYFPDMFINKESNESLAKFIHSKIHEVIDDPETARKLCARTYPVGTKRPCIDTNYFETFNKPNVRLVDLRENPLLRATENGIQLEDGEVQFDALVLATGFDAFTGALTAVNIIGEGGRSLKDKWAGGVSSYLGLMCSGFPNLFTITGPGSPSVLTNMIMSIEQHVDWVVDALEYVREKKMDSMSATSYAEKRWIEHSTDIASHTLFTQAESWYMGVNVPGKARGLLPYCGGLGSYREACDEVVKRDYLGFEFRGQDQTQLNDGPIRPLRADTQFFLSMMNKLPPPEKVEVAQLKAMYTSERPPLPPGARDGVYECADGTELKWRLYMPTNVEKPRLMVYFHGGAFVIGNDVSDEPLCKELCSYSDAAVLSFNYRHGPENPFPAAHDDAIAAVKWAAAHKEELGVSKGPIVLSGTSAGANLAIECTKAGVDVCGRLLIVPWVDTSFEPASYSLFGDANSLLSIDAMKYFMHLAADEKHWTNPRFAPLRAPIDMNTPPTAIFTAEVDPLRDEGRAYAAKLASAGVDVVIVEARGQSHVSISQAQTVPSGASIRKRMGLEVKRFFSS